MTSTACRVLLSAVVVSVLCVALCGGVAGAQGPDVDVTDPTDLQPGVPIRRDWGPPSRAEVGGTQGQPWVDLTTIEITTNRWQSWVDQPGGDQASVWKWTPCLDFMVTGPLADGCQLFCGWFMPDGKGWVRSAFTTPALNAGDLLRCRTSLDGMEPFAISQTGVFSFGIGFTRPGQEDAILFRGEAKINRFHVGNDLPKFKDDFTYYAEQDWKLPLGYLYCPTMHVAATVGATMDVLDESDLHFGCWFAQDDDALRELEAHLYRNGQEIVLPEMHEPIADGYEVLPSSDGTERCTYTRLDFVFCGVVGMAKEPDKVDEPRRYLLAKHPGEYEIRLVLNGQVVRTAKFTVGQDGKIVDETGAWKQALGTPRMPLPVTVLGTADRPWSKEAWKTDAFWGHPLQGFTAP